MGVKALEIRVQGLFSGGGGDFKATGFLLFFFLGGGAESFGLRTGITVSGFRVSGPGAVGLSV